MNTSVHSSQSNPRKVKIDFNSNEYALCLTWDFLKQGIEPKGIDFWDKIWDFSMPLV